MSDGPLILVAEDDDSLARVARHELERAGYRVVLAADGAAAWEAFSRQRPDALLSDVRMPGLDGRALVDRVLSAAPELPVIVMTAFGEVRDAVAALRRGAADYLVKPVDWEEVLLVLERNFERQGLRRENERLRAELAQRTSFDRLVGESAPMAALKATLARLAQVDATVLLEGESGTGKDLVARALHERGKRGGGPFVAINCGALPRDLVESQLFGHVKGAFTGAHRDAAGAFEQAHGGTLFLDELVDLPAGAQTALLRALEEGCIRPVGAERPRPVDVRVIAATNQSLAAAVGEGRFREDLYFRLAVIPLRLPPLRERGDDVLLLARHLLGVRGAGSVELAPEVLGRFAEHPWPGNVRELENALEHALLLRKDSGRIELNDLPEALRMSPSTLDAVLKRSFPAAGIDLGQLERECLQRALLATGGNQTRAAELLGLTRQTLIYRLAKHGLR